MGRWGEQTAREYLIGRGYCELALNVRTPYGEIDLIMEKDGRIVFIEVKTRSSISLGNPESSITKAKQKHMMESAQYYIGEHYPPNQEWQIDVVSILGTPGATPPQIEYFENVTLQ